MIVDVWYKEFTSPRGHLWRIEIEGAGAEKTGENLREIPDGLFVKTGELDIGWENLPIGLQKTGRVEMELDYRQLRTESDLLDLIENPTVTAVGTVSLNGYSRDINGGTVWRISCNYGNSAVGSGSAALRDSIVAIGVQRQNLPGRRHKITNAGTEGVRHRMNVVLVDAVRAAAEQIIPEDIAGAMIDNVTPPRGPHSLEIDRIYYSEAEDLIYVRFEKQDQNPQIWRRYYPLSDLYDTVHGLVEQAYGILLRDSTATLGFWDEDLNSGAYPFTYWKFYEQGYRDDSVVGVQLSDAYFIGTAHLAEDSGDTTAAVGGLLVDVNEDNQHSLFRFSNMWDVLKVSCESWGTRTRVVVMDRTTARVYYERLVDGAATPIADDELPKEIEYEQPGRTVARAIGAIPGLEGDDLAEYRSADYHGEKVEDEEDENIRGLFHNLPRVGDRTNVFHSYYINPPVGEDVVFRRQSIIDGDYIGVYSEDITPWKLFYFADATLNLDGGGTKTLLTQQMPIRVSEICSMEYGTAAPDEAFSGGGAVLPTGFGVPADSREAKQIIDSWWSFMAAYNLDIQRNANFMQVLCEAIALVFGHNLQAVYEGVDLDLTTLIAPSEIGLGFRLGSTGTASVFLAPADTYHDHVSTYSMMTRAKVAIGLDRGEYEFLHVEKPG